MEKENVDPVYVYVDHEIKLLKTELRRELKKLKTTHAATANEHTQALFKLQQFVAEIKIDSLVPHIRAIIDSSNFTTEVEIHNQLIIDASSAKSKIEHSEKPLDICIQFKKKWEKTLLDLSGNVITF
ncbi:hypothetical protein ACFLTL_00825 [Chloroflexota bacterium]